MKLLSLITLAAFLCVATPTFTGCTTPQTVRTYQTLNTVAVGVDVALKAWADLVVRGQVPESTIPQVKALKANYEQAFSIAISAAQFDSSAPASPQVVKLATELTSFIASLTIPKAPAQ